MKKSIALGMLISLISACKGNVDVKQGSTGNTLTSPTIAVPSYSPYYSNENNFLIQGLCQTDAMVILSGDANLQTPCSESSYSFNVTMPSDGDYYFSVAQIKNGKLSPGANVLWLRRTSVPAPTVTEPNVAPVGGVYSSSQFDLHISGGCITGNTIVLGLDASDSMICIDSQFSFTFARSIDGDYNIEVRQEDPAGNSASMQFVWQRRNLEVTPNNFQMVVGTSQVLSITGGTPPYTIDIVNNISGGTWDNGTLTYTAGTTSTGATGFDLIRVRDDLGYERGVQIQVIADVPDHFVFAPVSGDNQQRQIGLELLTPLMAQLVDRYENPVSNVDVTFQAVAGQVELLDPIVQRTDAQGFVQMNVRQGVSSVRSYVAVKPVLGDLPDVAGSGKAKLNFQVRSTNKNTNTFDSIFSTGNGAGKIISNSDLDGDGYKDVLVLNTVERSINVMLGAGNGLFKSSHKIVNLCMGVSDFILEDFNGDAEKDLILTCNGVDQYWFLEGIGNGTFEPASIRSLDGLEGAITSGVAGDFNGDGYKDLAFVFASSGLVTIRFGDGMGEFSIPAFYDVGTFPIKAVVGNFDQLYGDDLAVLDAADDNFTVLLSEASGGLVFSGAMPVGTAPSDILAGDFDLDGYVDVVVLNSVDNQVAVHINDQNGFFNGAINASTGLMPLAMAAGDIDADGILDLVVSNADEATLSVFIGFGNGAFDLSSTISTMPSVLGVNLEDLNTDGAPDLIVSSNSESKVQVLPNQNAEFGYKMSVGSSPAVLASGDFDEDNILDLIVADTSANTLQILKGLGNGMYSSVGNVALGGSPSDIVAVDLNQDGHLDLVLTLSNLNVFRIYLGNGDGTFQSPQTYPTQLAPSSLLVEDLNHDGRLDVVTTNSGSNSISIFLAQETGYSVRSDLSVGAQPTGIVAADFNLDMHLDLAVNNQSADSVSILIANGNGTFLPATTLAVGGGPNAILAGFFDNNTYVDLAVSNSMDSTVSILKGNGNGTFQEAVSFSAGIQPTSMAKGDFNNNGTEDIIVSNGPERELTILYGTAVGSFNTTKVIPVNASADKVYIRDVNKDGTLDILILDNSSGELHTLLGL